MNRKGPYRRRTLVRKYRFHPYENVESGKGWNLPHNRKRVKKDHGQTPLNKLGQLRRFWITVTRTYR
jgi:hypothetical protein